MAKESKQSNQKIYPEFNNIIISESRGVSPVGNDTKIIAKHASRLKPKSAIDMGSGTGFIPIYLRRKGRECDGADINPAAVENARKNANLNRVKINFYYSNLFENIEKRYGLIMFNPPYGSSNLTIVNKLIEIAKSFFPKGTVLTKLVYPFIKSKREELIKRFFLESKGHLTKNGKILILLDKSELYLIKNRKYKVLDDYGKGKLVLVTG